MLSRLFCLACMSNPLFERLRFQRAPNAVHVLGKYGLSSFGKAEPTTLEPQWDQGQTRRRKGQTSVLFERFRRADKPKGHSVKSGSIQRGNQAAGELGARAAVTRRLRGPCEWRTRAGAARPVRLRIQCLTESGRVAPPGMAARPVRRPTQVTPIVHDRVGCAQPSRRGHGLDLGSRGESRRFGAGFQP